jgi:hypothetical protein
VLSKDDLAQMTDGQREILFLGMKIENEAIIKILKKLNISEDVIAKIRRNK